MTEDEARAWISARYGDAAVARLAAFLDLVVAENREQNLIAPSTIGSIWSRHAVDSAQLLRFDHGGLWIDIGTGGGFPGIIVALLRDDPVMMVEPRARRAAFLGSCIASLGIGNARAVSAKIERVAGEQPTMISARAVASIDGLITAAGHLAEQATRWVLPRGRSGAEDVEALRERWQGVFHVEQSIVDPMSTIAILDEVTAQ